LEQPAVEVAEELVELVLGAPLLELADHVREAIRRGERHAHRAANAMPRRARRETPDRATTLHGSCSGARLAHRARRAGVAASTLEAHLQTAQGVERRVHAHQLSDQALRLLRHPAELLAADGLERAGELIVEAEQPGDVAH